MPGRLQRETTWGEARVQVRWPGAGNVDVPGKPKGGGVAWLVMISNNSLRVGDPGRLHERTN